MLGTPKRPGIAPGLTSLTTRSEFELGPDTHGAAKGVRLVEIQEAWGRSEDAGSAGVYRSAGNLVAKVGCIKSVEHIQAQFETRFLGEPEALGDGEVHVVEPGREQRVPSHCARIGRAAAFDEMHAVRINANQGERKNTV